MCNKCLKTIYLPSVIMIDNSFLRYNSAVVSVDMPNVERIGDYFMFDNKNIETLNLPKLNRKDYDRIIKRISYLKERYYDFLYPETFVDRVKRLLRIQKVKK